MQKIELLAPAGNFDCLVAAVQSGADAVYLAGKCFGARSFADNFDNDELLKATDYCHLRGVKIYVTVNTLVLDSEMDELREYLLFLEQIGVDAIIVQDLGVLELARAVAPRLPIHGSTQMTIHNLEGVKKIAKYGVKRVVLSRELSLDDIRYISENTDVELEIFAHGALCVCYSGQCLLSSIIGGRSGNRGKCAQPCRLQYSVNGKKEKKFYMSLKDLSGLRHLSKFLEMGVSSLKIEGRMKGQAYVAAVVGTFRKYIDNPQSIRQEDMDLLDSIFNRGGLTDGYLTGEKGKKMFAPEKPDNPYKKGSRDIEKEILSILNGENRRIKISGKIEIKKDSWPCFSISCGDIMIQYVHDSLPEVAQKLPIDAVGVIGQLSKTGGTPFEFCDISAEVEDGLFLSAGELNKIRREGLKIFEEAFINSFRRENASFEIPEVKELSCPKNTGFVCEVTTKEQLRAVLDLPFERFLIPLGIIKEEKSVVEKIKDKTVIVLPAILLDRQFQRVVDEAKNLLDDGFLGVQIHHISLADAFSEYRVFGGFRINVFNSHSVEFCTNSGLEDVELSPELTLKQIGGIKKAIPVQVMVYGRLPLMVTENCIIRNGSDCPCKGENFLRDRMGMVFPVIKDGDFCRSVILNCKKTFLAEEIKKLELADVSYMRMYFTDESFEETKKVCDTFLLGGSYKPEDFTKGHIFKGVTGV